MVKKSCLASGVSQEFFTNLPLQADWMSQRLSEAIAWQDRTTATLVVTESASCAPHETLEEVRTACEQRLVNEMTVNFRKAVAGIVPSDRNR